jgi:hypothetical protein
VRDRLAHTGCTLRLVGPAVGRAGGYASQVVAHRALGERQKRKSSGLRAPDIGMESRIDQWIRSDSGERALTAID